MEPKQLVVIKVGDTVAYSGITQNNRIYGVVAGYQVIVGGRKVSFVFENEVPPPSVTANVTVTKVTVDPQSNKPFVIKGRTLLEGLSHYHLDLFLVAGKWG